MNDESLTSDDLFRSGSVNSFIHFNGAITPPGVSNESRCVIEPQLNYLDERIHEDNETAVKEFTDPVDELVKDLARIRLTDEGEYANIHMNDEDIETDGGCFHKINRNGNQGNEIKSRRYDSISVGKGKASAPGLEATLKQPDLPAPKSVMLNEQLRSRGTHAVYKHGTVELENENNSKLVPPSRISRSRPLGNHILVDSSMADSFEPQQSAAQENLSGVRPKTKDTDVKKSKAEKRSKGGKFKKSESDTIPDPPFKLQHKKYDSQFKEPETNRFVKEISSYEDASTEHVQSPEIQPFPVGYLNPFVDPKGQKTVRPGARSDPDLSTDVVLCDENDSRISAQVVRPKIQGENGFNTIGIRHNTSDPQIHTATRNAVQRENIQLHPGSAENIHDTHKIPESNQPLRENLTIPNVVVPTAAYSDRSIQAANEIVRPKSKHVHITSIVSNKPDKTNETINMGMKKLPRRTTDNISMSISKSQNEARNSPPQRIEYINNLDTITTKKVENKDMKNTNRSRNMDKNTTVSIVNENSSSNIDCVETVEDRPPLQYNQEQPVIGIQSASRHILSNSNDNSNSAERLSENAEMNSGASPIIVPYQVERNTFPSLPFSLDGTLQSNVLFGDGTELSDHMLAKMLQKQYDKEHEQICRRNEFDIAPETLRLHNLTPDLNVADGGLGDPNLFNDDLQTDSLLIGQNNNDVYETSPRSIESDQERGSVDIVNNLHGQDMDSLYPDSITLDSLPETEQNYQQLVDEADEDQHGQQVAESNVQGTIHVPYITEHHREILTPETPDDGTIYVHAEREEVTERSDESFARSLQRQLLMEEQEHLDEELARQLEQEEQERERHRPRYGSEARHTGSQQPLHSRYSMWNSRPLEVRQESPAYHGTRQIQNTWDRPLRRADIYGNRQRLPRQCREGYDIYGNEYEPDLMPDQYGADDFVSISRDPHLLATVLMGRAPNMMVPDNVNLNDYEALWDLAEELGEVRRVGMDQGEISLLPVHTYQASGTAEGGDKDVGDCRVCLTDFSNGDKLRTLPCCHIYHVECIDEWLKRNAVCPVCRQSVRQ